MEPDLACSYFLFPRHYWYTMIHELSVAKTSKYLRLERDRGCIIAMIQGRISSNTIQPLVENTQLLNIIWSISNSHRIGSIAPRTFICWQVLYSRFLTVCHLHDASQISSSVCTKSTTQCTSSVRFLWKGTKQGFVIRWDESLVNQMGSAWLHQVYHASYVNFLLLAINMQCAWFLVALVNPTNRVNQVVSELTRKYNEK